MELKLSKQNREISMVSIRNNELPNVEKKVFIACEKLRNIKELNLLFPH